MNHFTRTVKETNKKHFSKAFKNPVPGYMLDVSINAPNSIPRSQDEQEKYVQQVVMPFVDCPQCKTSTQLQKSNKTDKWLECSRCHLWYGSRRWDELIERKKALEQFRDELHRSLRGNHHHNIDITHIRNQQ